MKEFCVVKTPDFGSTAKRSQIRLQGSPPAVKFRHIMSQVWAKMTFSAPVADAEAVSLTEAPVIKTSVENGINGAARDEGWRGFGRSETALDDMFTNAAL